MINNKQLTLLQKNYNILSTKFKESGKAYTGSHNIDEKPQQYLISDTYDDPDRDLNDAEREVLREFDRNDRELENIAARIASDLDSLGKKALQTGEALDEQQHLLQKANDLAENVELKLNKQNNDLQKAITKFRGMKQIWMDLFLLFILMGFIALLYNRLKFKNYL